MLSRCGRNAAKRGRGAVASMSGGGGGGGWARAATTTTTTSTSTSAVSIAKSGYESRVLPSGRATSALTWSRGFAAGATTTTTTTTTTTKTKPNPASAVKAVSEPSTSASSSSSAANAARQSSARAGVLVDVGFSGGFVDDDRRVPRALTVGALIAKLRRIELAMEREMERGLVAFDPGVGGFQMASVKRKRKKAMNKHKHRKRRRRDRHKA